MPSEQTRAKDRDRSQRPERKEQLRCAGNKYYHANKEKERDRFARWSLKKRLIEWGGAAHEIAEAVADFFSAEICQCCGDAFDDTPAGRRVVDHCHRRLILRGAICSRCNLILGHAQDDVARLQKVIEYLQERASWQ